MFQNILVPTDGSPLSEKAIAAAIDLARRLGGGIVGICVAEAYPYAPVGGEPIALGATVFEERSRELAQQHVERVAELARTAGVPCQTVVRQSFHPYEEIVRVAEEFNCDAIIMASHGRKGLNRLFVGSETQKVLAHTTLPVTVIR